MALPTVTPAPTSPPLQRRDEILLPLTTVFTPPDDCLTALFTLEDDSDPGTETFAWRDVAQTSSTCYPSSFSWLQNNWNWYSPGVCPSGYNIAQSRSWVTYAEPMTQAWCCPESFTISGRSMSGYNYQYCTSTAAGASVLSVDGNSTLIMSLSSFVAVQWPMSIEWASSDLAEFTPQSAPILVAAATTIYSLPSGVVVGTASAVSPSTGGATTHVHATSLSTGATAGIAVGVALAAVLAGISLAFWLLSRRRHRRQRKTDKKMVPRSDDPAGFFGGKFELPSEGRQIHRDPAVELNIVGRSPQEMEVPVHKKVGVQNINRSPVEVEGDYRPIAAPLGSGVKEGVSVSDSTQKQ